MLLSYSDGNGAVVTAINETPGSNQLVITFDGPLETTQAVNPAVDVANYQVTKALANPELVTSSGANVKVRSATYSDATASQVTLTLKSPLKQGVFYRIWINGTPASMSTNPNSNPLIDGQGNLIDGDNDNTAGGDFYGLFALGKKLNFVDSYGARVTLKATGGGVINVWRELDGDIDQLSVIGTKAASSTLTGSAVGGQSKNVYIGSQAIPVSAPLTLNGAANALPQSFVVLTQMPNNSPPAPTATSPVPVVATSANLPYTVSISPVNTAATQALPGLQSAVSATLAPTKAYPDGLWLIFGGRTNGLHEFTTSDVANFPPDFQNEKIYVINPATWQTWSVPWTATDVPQSVYNSLSSGEQEFYQQGNTLYTVGGYSVPDTINFTGNTTAGSAVIPVSSTEGLAIGQFLTASTIPIKTQTPNSPGGPNAPPPVAITTTITAIGTNTITISMSDNTYLEDIGTATGVALTASSNNFTTYDTLTSINIKGMINAVMNGGDMVKQAAIRQISDPRLAVTGGNMAVLGGRTYLVFGQNFQGGYNFSFPQMSNSTFTQIYSSEIQSFRIVRTRNSLAIRGYQALRDPVNFRRRDSNLQTVITPSGQRALTYYGGVFAPNPVDAYQSPVVITGSTKARVVASEQQYFDQYTTANIALYNANNHTLASVFMGGISYYDYAYPNGPLTTTVGPPTFSPGWVDDVTDIVQKRNGRDQEFIMPPIPGPGYYGGVSSVFLNPSVPRYSNGVIKLQPKRLKRPTVVAYIYGGIYSQAQQSNPSANTFASNQVFAVTLSPSR